MPLTPVAPTVGEHIVAFADLSGFHGGICARLTAEQTFQFLADYYATATAALGNDGRVVKFIGDAILCLLPADRPARSLAALRHMQAGIDALLATRGLTSRVRIKAHVGEVATGYLGSGETERFDVCGLVVNQTALLPDEAWSISRELQARAAR